MNVMEKKANNVNKKFVAQALINKIEKENQASEIKTRIVEGYEKPEKIVRQEDKKKGFVPDVISKSEEKTDLYEIELDQNFILEKWRLFSLYTNQLKGTFNIVTPESNLGLVKNALKENQIGAKIIYFSQ